MSQNFGQDLGGCRRCRLPGSAGARGSKMLQTVTCRPRPGALPSPGLSFHSSLIIRGFIHGQKRKPQGPSRCTSNLTVSLPPHSVSQSKSQSQPDSRGGDRKATSWWEEWHCHAARGHTGWERALQPLWRPSVFGGSWFCSALASGRLLNTAPQEVGIPKPPRTQKVGTHRRF